MSSALDRWITGNYGEDQFKGMCENEECADYDDCEFEYDKQVCANALDQKNKDDWDD